MRRALTLPYVEDHLAGFLRLDGNISTDIVIVTRAAREEFWKWWKVVWFRH